MLLRTRQYIKYLRKSRNEYSLHSPFMFDLYNAVFKKSRKKNDLFKPVEILRKELLNDKTILTVNDLGAGSKQNRSPQRKISEITANTAKRPRHARLLSLLPHYLQHKKIIELGTSLGISTAYMALKNPGALVYTIEGDKGICKKAQENFRRLQLGNIKSLEGNFDTILPDLLADIKTFDLLFIDGNHTYEATKRYFEMALPYINNHSVIVFDDIYWSEGMTQAWKEITAHRAVKASIDTYTFGIIFFRDELSKQDFILR